MLMNSHITSVHRATHGTYIGLLFQTEPWSHSAWSLSDSDAYGWLVEKRAISEDWRWILPDYGWWWSYNITYSTQSHGRQHKLSSHRCKQLLVTNERIKLVKQRLCSHSNVMKKFSSCILSEFKILFYNTQTDYLRSNVLLFSL